MGANRPGGSRKGDRREAQVTTQIITGDALTELKKLPSESVHCCVTSPPYLGLRDYGVKGQIGLESSLDDYLDKLVAVFSEVKRVLRKDGTCWVNIADSYAAHGSGAGSGKAVEWMGDTVEARQRRKPPAGLKPKDLCGVPWRLAFALQGDGWWLRSDIIWAKPSPMPESVTDRPTRSHEFVFLLTKAERYYYDAEAIKEPATTHLYDKRYGPGGPGRNRLHEPWNQGGPYKPHRGFKTLDTTAGRNARSVWTIPTQPRPENFYAAFPDELARRCILAGSPEKCCPVCGAPWERVTETVGSNWEERKAEGAPSRYGHSGVHGPGSSDLGAPITRTVGHRPTCSCEGNDGSGRAVVLDPFLGRGTTLIVAARYGRDGVGIELNPQYAEMAMRNIGAEGSQGWLFSKAVT